MNFLSLLCIVGLVGTAVAKEVSAFKAKPTNEECSGLMPGPPRQMVAFMATKVKPGTQNAQSGDIVTLDMAITNVGNAFDVTTSKFTCTVDGLYNFNFHVTVESGGPAVTLMKNGERVISFFVSSGSTYMGANSAVLLLAVGDELYLEVEGDSAELHISYDWQYTSFSGYLL